ncbi:alcohol dehydrogenase catalytic domain-containing protein [Ureaplasma miroungigenitalium]|uniref:Alcohol dehydrogenase catalytic domain-containing protein n=1 Tax=Ureaplasma miroungigenitalium TaxID=1042321 RepID=A0ABT3BMN2_9BACT|nr:alcohol dehydrogenase catalytic domain-containing protein [Ureaplasma miroungigenitalium]MCV3728490.1 alcohol dehydrogenase catalytic domain-containing protein [Ureaplasma miroungigenitalium]
MKNKALVYLGNNKIELQEMPMPEIKKPTDVIVKMLKTSICGTDLGILNNKNPEVQIPRILGHEGVGVIYAIGTEVKNFKVNDKVIISCISKCRKCSMCTKQLYAHCQEDDGGWKLGYMIDGTQAQFVRIPFADHSLHLINEEIDLNLAVMLSDALPTGHEIGVLYGEVKKGDDVIIIGAGPIGLSALITAQQYKPRTIIVLDLDVNRLATAKKMGATHTFLVDDQLIEELHASLKFADADVVIEAVGIQPTWLLAEKLVRVGGHLAVVGVHGKSVEFHLQDLWIKNIKVSTGLVNTNTTDQLYNKLPEMQKQVNQLITHQFDFEQICQAYEAFKNAKDSKAIKIIINF